jgi:hypothetical protein
MAICEWVFEVPESDSDKTVTKRDMSDITLITLSEFELRDMAVEIYSEVLRCTLWLSSDNAMADQIKEEAPGAVCYMASELRCLLKLKPRPEDLRAIHEAKVINPGSVIMEVVMKNDTKILGESYE